MATGVEIAGFVLASFPLVISALEHSREILKPLKDWYRYRTEFLKLSGTISVQETLFKARLDMLLGPIVTSDSEMAVLLNEPGGPEWGNRNLAERLQERLGDSHDSYLTTILEMNKILEELIMELRIVEVT